MPRAPLLLPAVLALAVPASTEPRTYVVDAAASTVAIHVGKAGLFKFAGHEHEVLAAKLRGEVVADPVSVGSSSVGLTFDAAALSVTGRGEPPGDVPKVQAKMVGPELLDVARFPEIVFRSRSVTGREATSGVYDITVTGDLSLHGVTQTLTLPLRVEVGGDTLTATGKVVLKHTAFGLRPVSVAGVVKVRNELDLDYKIVARAGP
ncbi:MAG: YceI family protein [Acidobacteria bacterium]|nr:YceI family protein [Acidobacteriota bacterium]